MTSLHISIHEPPSIHSPSTAGKPLLLDGLAAVPSTHCLKELRHRLPAEIPSSTCGPWLWALTPWPKQNTWIPGPPFGSARRSAPSSDWCGFRGFLRSTLHPPPLLSPTCIVALNCPFSRLSCVPPLGFQYNVNPSLPLPCLNPSMALWPCE